MAVPKGFRILSETKNYLLGNVYAYGSFIDKRNGKKIYWRQP
jgi:hypothetical protein